MSISIKSLLLPTRPLKVNREGEAYNSDYQLADIILMPWIVPCTKLLLLQSGRMKMTVWQASSSEVSIVDNKGYR